jgi:hypothetical protein
MEYGVWSMEYGVWSMEYGVWAPHKNQARRVGQVSADEHERGATPICGLSLDTRQWARRCQ